jgi:hypothetical protein
MTVTLKTLTIPASGGPSTPSGASYATSTTPTAEIPIGTGKLVRIVPSTGSVGVFVRFGPAGTNSANVNDVFIPYGRSEVFDMGPTNASICMFSEIAGTAHVSVGPGQSGGYAS